MKKMVKFTKRIGFGYKVLFKAIYRKFFKKQEENIQVSIKEITEEEAQDALSGLKDCLQEYMDTHEVSNTLSLEDVDAMFEQ